MAETGMLPVAVCRICSAIAPPFARALVMNRHNVQYYRCEVCGFVQTEEPYWLDEAYAEPITSSDIGLVSRNLGLACITKSVISMCFDASGRFLDYAGGYGLLVRLMRDAGYDFLWYDRYCNNLFANGFAVSPEECTPFDLVTAFEVIEHMRNPLQEMEEVISRSRNVLFTTEIIPPTPPQPESWWYYGLDHGQHISLFTLKSLEVIAQKFSLNFYTNGKSIHLFTEKRISPILFRLASLYRYASLFNIVYRRASLQSIDYEEMQSVHGKAK